MTMDFFLDSVALPLLWGSIGMCLMWLGKRLVTAAHVRQQFRDANENLVCKVQELVRAQNEVLLLELEVQELVEKVGPKERSKWLEHMRDIAHSVPPMVLLQLERFDLAKPPPPAALPDMSHVVQATDAEADDGFAQVTELRPSPWTGRAAGQ